MVTSIFRPDEPCEMAEKQSPDKSCCKGNICSSSTDAEQHNCSDCTSQFVKLDAKYLLPTFFDLKPLHFVAPQQPAFDLAPSIAAGEKMLLRGQQDLPPPPAGKTLLPWIQSFLC
jgi:hypothetical protein